MINQQNSKKQYCKIIWNNHVTIKTYFKWTTMTYKAKFSLYKRRKGKNQPAKRRCYFTWHETTERQTSALTHPRKQPWTRHVVPRRCHTGDFHTVLLHVGIVGLPFLPKLVGLQRRTVDPDPRVSVVGAGQADPGDATVSLHEVQLLPAGYFHQVGSPVLAVLSAVCVIFLLWTGRHEVALVPEFDPSTEASSLCWKAQVLQFSLGCMFPKSNNPVKDKKGANSNEINLRLNLNSPFLYMRSIWIAYVGSNLLILILSDCLPVTLVLGLSLSKASCNWSLPATTESYCFWRASISPVRLLNWACSCSRSAVRLALLLVRS